MAYFEHFKQPTNTVCHESLRAESHNHKMNRHLLTVCVQDWQVQVAYIHAYLESVLRLCLLFLEGFRGNELGMMGVGVQGRLLQARGMQACEEG